MHTKIGISDHFDQVGDNQLVPKTATFIKNKQRNKNLNYKNQNISFWILGLWLGLELGASIALIRTILTTKTIHLHSSLFVRCIHFIRHIHQTFPNNEAIKGSSILFSPLFCETHKKLKAGILKWSQQVEIVYLHCTSGRS